MNKANKPLVVSKDLVKELQRLAIAADVDESDFEEAKRRYERAATQALSSASQFAIRLYDFTLKFADTPQLISEKLKELGRQIKSTSTVYNNISRLAFDGLEEGGAKRTRISRYATLIEKAHKQDMSVTDFKKLVESGLKNAERKLFAEPEIKDTRVLKKARDIASKLINNDTYELTGVTLAEQMAEGSELQLLAEYKNGKIIVYGLVPPHLSNTKAILAKLVTSTTKPEKQKHDLMKDMLNVIKLVAKTRDENSVASYRVKDGKLHFIVSAKIGGAVLTAPSSFDMFQQDITLSVADWGRLLSTLIPLRKHISSIEASADEVVVSVDENAIPDIGAWMERKRHGISIGKPTDANLVIRLNGLKEHLEELTGRWELLASVPTDKIEQCFKFVPSKKYTTIEGGKDAIRFASMARLSDEHDHLTKPSYRQLKSASVKMKGWANELSFETRKNQLRVSANMSDGTMLSVFVGIE